MQQQNIPSSSGETEAVGHAFSMFSAFIDQLEEEILVVDANGIILNLNDSLLAAWGGIHRADYIGKNCGSLEGGGEYGRISRSFVEMVKNADRRVNETLTEVTSDGRMHYYHISAFPLRDNNGNARYFVLTRRDTTAQAQIEQRLYQSQKMAAVGELSTYIAHEIRNPLFAIGGFANSLLRTPSLDEAAREKAHIILEESQRLDEILKSIINFARPTDQDVGAVDINAVVTETVELMSIGNEERTIPIEVDIASSIPNVHGNADLLKQCLINLVKNAREAMENQQGGIIKVRTRYGDAVVHLEVEDNGPGIPVELQDKIFSPFFSTKDKGAGLGLAMTRKILNEIGGKLHLYSNLGKGTLMSMALQPILAVSEDFGESPNTEGAA